MRISERRTRWLLVTAMVLTFMLFGPGHLNRRPGKGRIEIAKMKVSELSGALDLFRFDIGRYPLTEEGLKALVRNPGLKNWAGPYVRKGVPPDPWGREYQYRGPGLANDPKYRIWTWGADGKPGGEGDAADVEYEEP